MKCLWLPILLCAVLAAPVVSRADFAAGQAAYDAGDFKTAMQEWLPLAEAGDGEAQFRVGRLYDVGEGVSQNGKMAKSWYEKSARQNNLKAAFNLGLMFYEGELIERNYRKSFHYWKLAADLGNPEAQLNLGLLYVSGRGIGRDFEEGYKWFFIAEKSGEPSAKEAMRYFMRVVPVSKIENGRQRAEKWQRQQP